MKIFFKLFFIACAVALAGAAIPVSASEITEEDVFLPTPVIDDVENIEPFPDYSPSDPSSTDVIFPDDGVQDFQSPVPSFVPDISSESSELGVFGNDDSFVDDVYEDLVQDLGDSGFDFVVSSPEPSSSPVFDSIPSPSVFFVDDDGLIEPYSSYNTYYGGISSTYLEFMRGFLPKLGFKEHYVASRTSQYNYIFAFGEDLFFNGSSFLGSNITVITWNTYNNGTYSYGVESNFSLYPGSYLVYSDLSDFYPSLADTAGFTLRQILILITIFILGVVIDHMYQVRKIRRLNK